MSSIKLIYDYWRERYPASVFLPFAILLAAAGAAAGGSLPTVRDAIKAGILAYTYGRAKSGWSNFFWVLTALAGFKAMIDMSRIKQK